MFFILSLANTNFEQKLIKIENDIRKCCNVFFLKINITFQISIVYLNNLYSYKSVNVPTSVLVG